MYADDTQLIRSTCISRIQCTIKGLQTCVADIHSWCRSRRTFLCNHVLMH